MTRQFQIFPFGNRKPDPDRIYIGQLRNGRPIPDYTRSTETNVTVGLDNRPAYLNFVLLAIRVNQRLGRNLRVEDLLALWEIWQHHTTTPATLSVLLTKYHLSLFFLDHYKNP